MSPYYRGSATIFWALYNGEPEYIGATIHQIDLKIDTGAIFHQVRPEISGNDNPHTLGCKTLQCGTSAMIQTLKELEAGQIEPVPQWEKGKVYLQRHFRPEHARNAYKMLADGLLQKYLERKELVYHRMRLIH